MCRIPETYPDNHYSSSDDEYFDGYISEPALHMKPKHMYHKKRTGGSLSLSENEMDSDDLEIPVAFNLSEKTRERLNSASKSNKTKEELLNAVAQSGGVGSRNGSPGKVTATTTGGEGKGNTHHSSSVGSSPVKSSVATEEEEDYVEIVK